MFPFVVFAQNLEQRQVTQQKGNMERGWEESTLVLSYASEN